MLKCGRRTRINILTEMINTSVIYVLIYLIQPCRVNTECPSYPDLRCCPDTVWNDEQNKCVGCPAGYLGPNCTISCDPPHYGVECQFTCACKGSETCHPSFGCVIPTTTTIEKTTKITTIETTTTMTTTEDDIRTTEADEVATSGASATTKTANVSVGLTLPTSTGNRMFLGNSDSQDDTVTVKNITLLGIEYESQHSYIGAALGRVTERIKDAKFEIDGVEFKVSANDNNIHQVHGGTSGFDTKMFTASINGDTVVMKYVSPDGEEGFPGEVTAEFTFRLTEENELILGYTATTTKPTPVNLSNHVYFNLAGHGAGNVGDHILTVNSGRHIPLDKEYIPLGNGTISDVKETPFDLTTPTQLRERMKDVLVSNYVFEGHGKKKHVAKLELPSTGRTVDCYTTEPCMETYFSCAMRTMTGKNGATYGAYENGGICLIPMQYSSAVNMPNFPNMILQPGQTYTQTTSYKFGF